MKAKKTDSEISQELQCQMVEQQRLNNESISLVNRERQLNMVGNKIEQARRNVEVISRVINSFEGTRMHDKMEEMLLLNLEVMKKVSKL